MKILKSKNLNKSIILYLLYSTLLYIFNLIYSQTHNYFSIFSTFSFLIPFVLGFGIVLIIKIKKIRIPKISFYLYNLATIFLSNYFLFKGIFEITEIFNKYTNILLYISIFLFIISFMFLLPICFLHFFPIDPTISSK